MTRLVLPFGLSRGLRVAALLGALCTGLLGAAVSAAPVAEARFQAIGGIEQWLTLQGEDRANPAILFLHGGPGNPLSPYAKAIYGEWARDFTLVQWDQRGAGKTFGRNPGTAEAALSLDQMVSDGIEVAEHLTRHLGQRKLVLMGSSWGSVLGLHMVKRRPDLFHAYIGSAQLVQGPANSASSYALTLARAEAASDAPVLAALKALGAPPHTNPRAFGVLRRATRKFEAQATDPAPRAWWQPEADYASPAAQAEAEQGEDYSFLQFVGPTGAGIYAQIDLYKLGTVFALPLYFVHGQEDLVTPLAVTGPYVAGLQAPDKAWVVLPRTGHDPNEAMRAAQYQLLMDKVRPAALAQPAP